MAAGRRGALSAVVVMVAALAPLLLAGVVRADCFAYCFKDCISKDKSMTDYCNYACDKTCDPGAPQRPLATGSDIGCQLSCARASCDRLVPGIQTIEHNSCAPTAWELNSISNVQIARPWRPASGRATTAARPSPCRGLSAPAAAPACPPRQARSSPRQSRTAMTPQPRSTLPTRSRTGSGHRRSPTRMMQSGRGRSRPARTG